MMEDQAASSGGVNDDGTKVVLTTTARRWDWEYSLRKYLLLLATLVATVTYTAVLSPPGGVWQVTDRAAGHLAGDAIMRDTNRTRYAAFFYLNTAAFASSLVVIVLILILSLLHENKNLSLAPLCVLRGFMLVDLLSLIGAYAAGTYRDRHVPVYNLVLTALTVVYVVVFHMVLPCCTRYCWGNENKNKNKQDQDLEQASPTENGEREKLCKVLMLLATFAVSVTYLAGLNAPGGFWDHADEGGGQPGEPVLIGSRHEQRLKAFDHFNATSFFFSLLVAVQLLDKNNLHKEEMVRFPILCVSIICVLLGLVGAYTTGSTRGRDTTIYGTLLVGASLTIVTCTILVLLWPLHRQPEAADASADDDESRPRQPDDDGRNHGRRLSGVLFIARIKQKLKAKKHSEARAIEKARSLVLLLATLAATITYQAALDPPGGLWQSDGVGHKAGDPILLTKNPRRYKVFFYCNSVTFVASLVAIVLVKKRLLLNFHALEAAMILDLFGLIGAYAAGSCRDVNTSIYAMALAGVVLVYVVIHVVFFTLDHVDTKTTRKDLEKVEKRRKRLLLFAILAATISYQAGLTPPGAFHFQDDAIAGHHAGDPVLHHNFPRRYKAFFYCNSVSFMLSIALILLLVNPNIYKPAIQSHALSVCTAVGMASLVGAYAAGSTQHLKTSIKIFGLVALILTILVLAVMVKSFKSSSTNSNPTSTSNSNSDSTSTSNSNSNSNSDSPSTSPSTTVVQTNDSDTSSMKKEKEEHKKRKYLMLLGILGASVTYQVGLKPPGGVWQSNDDMLGHVAGNPVMHDNGWTRYLTFFYINSTSFVASIIVIMLSLLEFLPADKKCTWLLTAMNTTIVLDVLGLLVAYAVGSSRSWKTTVYVFTLVIAVLVYIAIHVLVSFLIHRDENKEQKSVGQQKGRAGGQ